MYVDGNGNSGKIEIFFIIHSAQVLVFSYSSYFFSSLPRLPLGFSSLFFFLLANAHSVYTITTQITGVKIFMYLLANIYSRSRESFTCFFSAQDFPSFGDKGERKNLHFHTIFNFKRKRSLVLTVWDSPYLSD